MQKRKVRKQTTFTIEKDGIADNTKYISINEEGLFMFSNPAIAELDLGLNNHARFFFNQKTKIIKIILTNRVKDDSRPIRIHKANGMISAKRFFNVSGFPITKTRRFKYTFEIMENGAHVYIPLNHIYPKTKKLPNTVQLAENQSTSICENVERDNFVVQDNRIALFNQFLDLGRPVREDDIEFLCFCVEYGIGIGMNKKELEFRKLMGL